MEYTIVETKFSRQNLFIITLYANNDSGRQFTDELNTLFNGLKLHLTDNFYIIAGDFNVRHTIWGDSVDKEKGILLKNWLDYEGLEYKANIIPPSEGSFP